MSGAMNRGFSFPERSATRAGETGQATGMMETAKQSAKDFGSAVGSKAEEAWDASKRTAQQFASSASDQAQDAVQTVTDLIHRYPLYSLLIAFGAGFLLAEVLRFPTGESTSTFAHR